MGLYKIAPYLGAYYYVFNVQQKPFDDVRVRKAFALSIQRQGLIDHIIRAEKEPAYAWVPPGLKDKATGRDFGKKGAISSVKIRKGHEIFCVKPVMMKTIPFRR